MFCISEITSASNSNIYHNVAHDSLYISTRNDVTICFLSAANRTNVSLLGHVRSRFLDNGSIDFKKVYSFGKGDSSTSTLLTLLDILLLDREDGAQWDAP